MGTRMEQRRGLAAEWAAANVVLADGEIGVEKDTGIVKIGDGITAWNSLTNTYIRKSQMDASYIDRTIVDAAGDLLVGSADNTVTRLPKGTQNQRLTIDASGNLVWADLPPATNPFTAVDAAGDLLVGTGPDAVGRLAKGSNGQSLTIDANGNLVWATASAIDSSKVAKAGDTMTGKLITAPMTANDPGLELNGVSSVAANNPASLLFYRGPNIQHAGIGWFPNESTFRFRRTGSTFATGTDDAAIRAGAIYDNGNRVYSASNPPPVSGMTILAAKNSFSGPANTYNAAATFVAPTSGRVVVWGKAPSNNVTLNVSLDGGTTAMALSSSNTSDQFSSDFVAFEGLTPGATYTVYLLSGTTTSYTFFVEG